MIIFLRNHIWIERKLKLYLHYQKIDRKIFKSFIFPVSILGEKSGKIFIFIKIINAILYNTNFCIFFTRIVFISFLKIHLLFTSLFPPKLNPELSTLISMMIKNVYHRIDVAGMYAYLSCLSTLVTKKTYRKCWVFFYLLEANISRIWACLQSYTLRRNTTADLFEDGTHFKKKILSNWHIVS